MIYSQAVSRVAASRSRSLATVEFRNPWCSRVRGAPSNAQVKKRYLRTLDVKLRIFSLFMYRHDRMDLTRRLVILSLSRQMANWHVLLGLDVFPVYGRDVSASAPSARPELESSYEHVVHRDWWKLYDYVNSNIMRCGEFLLRARRGCRIHTLTPLYCLEDRTRHAHAFAAFIGASCKVQQPQRLPLSVSFACCPVNFSYRISCCRLESWSRERVKSSERNQRPLLYRWLIQLQNFHT
nr:hypothetical protein CFP56_03967 [Quercus suber]